MSADAGSGTAPPGWYDDGSGWLRSWDGQSWGVYAPPPQSAPAQQWSITTPPTGNQLVLMFSWYSFFIIPVVIPLLIYVTEGKKDRFTRWHSAEAFNLQLTWAIEMFVLFVGAAAVSGSTGSPDSAAAEWVPVAIAMLLLVVNGVAIIVGSANAWRGRCRRCLVAVPFLRAHRREGAPQTA